MKMMPTITLEVSSTELEALVAKAEAVTAAMTKAAEEVERAMRTAIDDTEKALVSAAMADLLVQQQDAPPPRLPVLYARFVREPVLVRSVLETKGHSALSLNNVEKDRLRALLADHKAVWLVPSPPTTTDGDPR